MVSIGENELCCYIKNYFSTSYVCYTYMEIKTVFFDGKNYKNSINHVLNNANNKFGNSLVLALAGLLNAAEKQPWKRKIIRVYHHRDVGRPVDFFVTNHDWISDVYLCCRTLAVPLMHVLFFYRGHQAAKTLLDRIKNEVYAPKISLSPTSFYEIKEFNLIKSQYQINYDLYRHYSEIFTIYYREVTLKKTQRFCLKRRICAIWLSKI